MTNPLPAAGPAMPLTPAEDKQWASFAHFGGIFWFIPALVIFAVFKDRGFLARQESKEALNWQITYTIAAIAVGIVVSVVSAVLAIAGAWPLIYLLSYLPFLLYVVNAVYSVIGGVRVNAGGAYRYPFALRLIK